MNKEMWPVYGWRDNLIALIDDRDEADDFAFDADGTVGKATVTVEVPECETEGTRG